MVKKLFYLLQREFISKRILPTFKHVVSDDQLVNCFISQAITILSVVPFLWIFCFVCLGLDFKSLYKAWKNRELFQWQSAVSILSIVLTLCGLCFPQLSLMFGIASVLLDVGMLIYAISVHKKDYKAENGIDSLPKKEN